MTRLVSALVMALTVQTARAEAPLCTWAREAVVILDTGGHPALAAKEPPKACKHAGDNGRSYLCVLASQASATEAEATLKGARAALEKCFPAPWIVRERKGQATLADAKGLAIEWKKRGVYLGVRGVPDAFHVELTLR